MDDYNSGGHSKYSMKVHIIFVTKYRKKIFKSDKQADDVKQFLYDIAKKHEYAIIQMIRATISWSASKMGKQAPLESPLIAIILDKLLDKPGEQQCLKTEL